MSHGCEILSRLALTATQRQILSTVLMAVVKPALLESIFLLGRGRSFKHRDLRLVVNNKADQLVVSAKIYRPLSKTTHQLGIKRSAKGDFEARCDGQSIKSAAELALELPLQIIDAQSFSLIEGGPLQRRQFLDWGVFHVEHHYADLWRRFQKSFKTTQSTASSW